MELDEVFCQKSWWPELSMTSGPLMKASFGLQKTQVGTLNCRLCRFFFLFTLRFKKYNKWSGIINVYLVSIELTKKNTWLWARDFYRATVDESGLEPESVISHKSRTNNLIVLVEFLFDFFQLTISNWFYTFFLTFRFPVENSRRENCNLLLYCVNRSSVLSSTFSKFWRITCNGSPLKNAFSDIRLPILLNAQSVILWPREINKTDNKANRRSVVLNGPMN